MTTTAIDHAERYVGQGYTCNEHASSCKSELSGVISKKRKRKEQVNGTGAWDPFTISTLSDRAETSIATTFAPQCHLSRVDIPFSFLDGGNRTFNPKFISANIAPLNQLGVCADEHIILVARCLSDQCLYAIERTLSQLFTLCKLASWVSLPMIDRLQSARETHKKAAPLVEQRIAPVSKQTWWQAASITPNNLRSTQPDIVISETSKAPRYLFREEQGPRPEDMGLEHHSATHYVTIPEGQAARSPDSASQPLDDTLRAVRKNYEEALYASKASLAYFAKGPLSRARAFFQSYGSSSIRYAPLIDYLKSLLLSVRLLDKKYKVTVPNIVAGLPFRWVDADDSTSILSSMKKARKSKKIALKKNGLFPDEDIVLTQWWLNKDTSSLPEGNEAAREECTRSLLLNLKSRETQLQIILILETLALETALQDSENKQDLITNHMESTMLGKIKKPQDLDTLLDISVDRLSIWQTMAMDVLKPKKDDQQNTSQASSVEIKPRDKPNLLYQFCVDVLIPFYGARLPEKTKVLCQKLGGPKDPTPKRPALVKCSPTQRGYKRPGAAIFRPQVQKGRKTLERVLTDERPAHRRQTPSLSRSATEPTLPQLKREISDVPLSCIPAHQMATSRRYSQREVDLRTTKDVTEAKVKKKAQIEQELQGAIAALKKPNARMAVKEIVEAAEKRAGDSRSRKPLNPKRNPFATHVVASPSKDRQKNAPLLPRRTQSAAYEAYLDEIPPSSVFKVPDSTVKAVRLPKTLSRTHAVKAVTTCEIEQTPTRGSARFTNLTDAVHALPNIANTPAMLSRVRKVEAPTLEPEGYSPKLPAYPQALRETQSHISKSLHLRTKPCNDANNHVQVTPVKGQKVLCLSENALSIVAPPRSEPDDVCDDADIIELL